MPSRKYNGRYSQIYFPSQNFLQEWKGEAEKARMPLSAWIFATVESNRTSLSERAISTDQDLQVSREENRRLRRELEAANGELERQRAELFKLKNEVYLRYEQGGKGELDERLIAALRSGGHWRPKEILAELQIDQRDADAIQIVTWQLHLLQRIRMVQETSRGWRWMG